MKTISRWEIQFLLMLAQNRGNKNAIVLLDEFRTRLSKDGKSLSEHILDFSLNKKIYREAADIFIRRADQRTFERSNRGIV